ncbi:MAG: hypothetical protein AB3N63_08070, partial [Puniceicoccaceae bacterium]
MKLKIFLVFLLGCVNSALGQPVTTLYQIDIAGTSLTSAPVLGSIDFTAYDTGAGYFFLRSSGTELN